MTRGEAAAAHENSGHEGERGGVRAVGGSGQRARADPERVVPGNPAGQRERPGGEIRRFRQSRPGAHGELVALRAILLNVLFKLVTCRNKAARVIPFRLAQHHLNSSLCLVPSGDGLRLLPPSH